MPTTPSATWSGWMRAPMSRMSVQFTAKYVNAPKPANPKVQSVQFFPNPKLKKKPDA
jgi:hypothetical protein